MKETKSLLILHALTPSHVGTGDTIATIDLPIQREKHTNYPIIYASSVKGAFRDHYRKAKGENKIDINDIFGTDKQDMESIDDSNKEQKDKDDVNQPSLVSFSDARILAFPMRSNVSPFIHVTCPYVINRFIKDLRLIDYNNKEDPDILKNLENIPDNIVKEDEYIEIKGNFDGVGNIIIEEAILNKKDEKTSGNKNFSKNESLNKLIKLLDKFLKDVDKLVLVSDEMFSYCVNCTEIQTNIKIDAEKGVTIDGSLRYQEFLPSETVLYDLVWFGNKDTNDCQENIIKNSVQKAIKNYIQIGGDETLGKGIFNINWFDTTD